MRVVLLAAVVALGACTRSECEDDAYQCDGNILQQCADGEWQDEEDCDVTGTMCHAEMGHCMVVDSGM